MRLKLLTRDEMNQSQRETYDEQMASKSAMAPPPMMVWLSSPEMALHATRLGRILRHETVFAPKHAEIAILVTARHWTSDFEWYAHKNLALKGGVDPQVIDDILNRRTPTFDDPKARVIYDVAKSMHECGRLSKSLYDEAVAALGDRGLTEIVALCGYYTLVAMTLNFVEFPLPDGAKSDFE